MALISGRPDGRLAQYIYPDGLGGVIDYRLPAKDMGSKEEAAKVLQRVVNVAYRGLEKLMAVWSGVPRIIAPSSGTAYINHGEIDLSFPEVKTIRTVSGHGANVLNGLNWLMVSKKDNKIFKPISRNESNHSIAMWEGTKWSGALLNTEAASYVGTEFLIIPLKGEANTDITSLNYGGSNVGTYTGSGFIKAFETNLSVSGNFTMTDVIGSPAEILKVDALKNGWLGSWIPDFDSANPELTRKSVIATLLGSRLSTTNSGDSWVASQNISVSNPVNTVYRGFSAGVEGVAVINYTAFAKQTKPSVNKPVLNGSEGLGDVWEHSFFDHRYGSLLAESLADKVCTDSATGTYKFGAEKVMSFVIDPLSEELHTSLLPLHQPLRLAAPTNNSPAVKTLWHQTVDNKQVGLNFLWNELVWNSTAANWGDDSTIRIIDGTGTYNNLNGDSCSYGASELAIPYGYTKG